MHPKEGGNSPILGGMAALQSGHVDRHRFHARPRGGHATQNGMHPCEKGFSHLTEPRVGVYYLPVNRGSRFSMNAFMPSLWSSVAQSR